MSIHNNKILIFMISNNTNRFTFVIRGYIRRICIAKIDATLHAEYYRLRSVGQSETMTHKNSGKLIDHVLKQCDYSISYRM